MPKRTTKYMSALELAGWLVIENASQYTQEQLYRILQERGYAYDPNAETLWNLVSEQPDPPSQLIRVRVWAESSKVGEVANRLASVLSNSGFELMEQSEPYVCRPPKQLESRIYLSFRQTD